MSFVVVFSKATGRIRSIFVPDDDEQIKNLKYLDGEDHVILDDKDKLPLPELQELINKQTGIIPKDDRYAVVDAAGEVKAVIIADPLCGDEIKDHELITSTEAEVGHTWDKDAHVFVPPVKAATTTPAPTTSVPTTPAPTTKDPSIKDDLIEDFVPSAGPE